MAAKFWVFVDEDRSTIPTLYWSPKLHVSLLILVHALLPSCLYFDFTTIKKHVIKYCTTVYEKKGKKSFWSIKNSGEIFNKLKSKSF